MRRKLAEQWAELLLSNPKAQCRGQLFEGDKYCCAIGALTTIINSGKPNSECDHLREPWLIMEMNDGSPGVKPKSFKEIAIYIDLNSDQL